MLRFAALLIAAGLAVPAWGQEPPADQSATLSWGAPTMNTDGSPLTDLAGYKLYWGTQTGVYPNSVKVADPEILTYVIEGLARSTTYYFVATAYNTAGIESQFSNVASKTTGAGTVPAAPLNLTVQAASPTAYMLQLSHDAMALVPVGTAPAGVACGSQNVTDRNGITAYMIPSDAVHWAGSVRSGATFAQCSAG